LSFFKKIGVSSRQEMGFGAGIMGKGAWPLDTAFVSALLLMDRVYILQEEHVIGRAAQRLPFLAIRQPETE
jgi:hypothetical protein